MRRTTVGCITSVILALSAACASGAGTGAVPDAGSGYKFPGVEPGGSEFVEHPHHSEFQIGNAVSPINYWMTAWMLNDIFKMAGFEAEIGNTEPSTLWVPVVEGQWRSDLRYEVPTDELGWATSMELPDGTSADSLMTIVAGGAELPDTFPAGSYRLVWRGNGEILIEGAELVETEASYTPDEDGYYEAEVIWDGSTPLMLSILDTDPAASGDYIRDISILRPDAVAGERFNREYLAYLRPYTVIRPLHMTGDQLTYGPSIAWEDRKPENYSHWGGALGAPYEVVMDLANQSESDLWLIIPVAASDSFVRELARLALEELDSDRKLYIELGNELWNWSDPYALGREYALQQAVERWPDVLGEERAYTDGDPVDELMIVYSWQGTRTVEVANIFDQVWGAQSDRVVSVLAGQIGASHPFWFPSRFLLGTPVAVGEEGLPPAGEQVDAFAVAPYISEEEGVIEFSDASAEAFLDDARRYVRGEPPYGPDAPEPGMRYMIRSDRELAAEYGLPLISYEGGQHFTGSRFKRDEVNVSQAMYDLYRALYTTWREEGGGLFTHYAGIIPRGQNEPGTEPTYYQSENFGIKELQTQSPAEAPKWRATLDAMREAGQL